MVFILVYFTEKTPYGQQPKMKKDNRLGYHPRRKFDTRAGMTDSQSSEFPPGVELCPSVASVKPRRWGTVCGPRSPPPLNSIFPPLSGHHGLKPTCCYHLWIAPSGGRCCALHSPETDFGSLACSPKTQWFANPGWNFHLWSLCEVVW